MKSIFDPNVSEQLIARVNSLDWQQKAIWGEMSVAEMLHHCNLVNNSVLQNEMPYQKPTLRQRFLKLVFLYLINNFPRNRKGPRRLMTKGSVAPERFEEVKHQGILLIKQLAGRREPISLVHPMFGYLSKHEWGVAIFKHLDHHLRQFGV